MKQQSWKLITIVILALALAACELPAPNPPVSTSSPDLIATQVAAMLTASPAPTQLPPPVVTATSAPTQSQPTATSLPPTNPPPPPATIAPTAAPTNTPPPTSTMAPVAPTATPTISPNDPAKTLGSPTFSDTTFQEGVNWGSAWKNEFTEGSFSNNKLVFTSVGVDGWTFSWPKIANFYMEMTATTGTCAGKDRYGIIFRAPDTFDQGYQFGITCDGHYTFRRFDPAAKKYVYIVDWTKSDMIQQGSDKTNRLGVMAQGSKFGLYINGVLVKEAQDSTYSEGRFGPWIGHDQTKNFTISISEFAYWELP